MKDLHDDEENVFNIYTILGELYEKYSYIKYKVNDARTKEDQKIGNISFEDKVNYCIYPQDFFDNIDLNLKEYFFIARCYHNYGFDHLLQIFEDFFRFKEPISIDEFFQIVNSLINKKYISLFEDESDQWASFLEMEIIKVGDDDD